MNFKKCLMELMPGELYGGFFCLFILSVNLRNENEVFPDLNKSSCEEIFVYLGSGRSAFICSVHKTLCIYSMWRSLDYYEMGNLSKYY